MKLSSHTVKAFTIDEAGYAEILGIQLVKTLSKGNLHIRCKICGAQ